MIPGSKLREYRHANGVGLAELAMRLDRSKQAVAAAETRDVTPDYARRYLQAVYDATDEIGVGPEVAIVVSTFLELDDGRVTRLLNSERTVRHAEH